jgi:hypothetical protein
LKGGNAHNICPIFGVWYILGMNSRDELVVRAIEFVNSSHLKPGDKKLIVGRVPFVSESVLRMFVAVCEENPFGIDVFVKSLRAKLEASGNLKKLHEVLVREAEEVERDLVID